MTLADIKKDIEEYIKKLEKVEKQTDDCLKNAPDEILFTRKKGNKVFYYKRLPKRNSQRFYLDRNHQTEIKVLEEKGYHQELNKTSTEEIADLSEMLEKLKEIKDINRVFLSIPEEKRHLIKTFVIKNEMPKLYFKKQTRSVSSSYKTMDGENVRSKSELIIADRLKAFGVPYMYEPPILMDDELETWYPDFYVYNVRTGDEYVWEHFGMMDKPDYCESFQYKLERYAEQGRYPGKNLIFTTESTTHPLNTDYVDSLIKQYLV